MGEGEPGKGAYERSFEFILNSNFLEIRNKATYPPSPHNKNMGEVHEDIGYLSYDGSRKIFILRQFHKEGFVNQYRLDSISPDKKTLVFITEAIENIPPGWKAKETWQVSGENTFSETFELAESGKEFNVYTRVKFSKYKQPIRSSLFSSMISKNGYDRGYVTLFIKIIFERNLSVL